MKVWFSMILERNGRIQHYSIQSTKIKQNEIWEEIDARTHRSHSQPHFTFYGLHAVQFVAFHFSCFMCKSQLLVLFHSSMSNKTVRCIHCIAFDIPRIKNHFEIEWVLSMRCYRWVFYWKYGNLSPNSTRIFYSFHINIIWPMANKRAYEVIYESVNWSRGPAIRRNWSKSQAWLFEIFAFFFSSHHKTNVISQCLRLCLCPTCTFLLPHSRWPKRDCKKQSKKSQF